MVLACQSINYSLTSGVIHNQQVKFPCNTICIFTHTNVLLFEGGEKHLCPINVKHFHTLKKTNFRLLKKVILLKSKERDAP